MSKSNPTVPFGYCHCGCGKKAAVAKQNDAKRGYVKGQPTRYAYGHKGPYKPDYLVDGNGCWIWQRARSKTTGYGYTAGRNRRTEEAHRVYYERYKGPIPAGMQIDHLCRNRPCVNPDHLEAVTCAENLRRGYRTKLDPDKVREIRRRHNEGVSYLKLARRYGVGVSTIQGVCERTIWRDVF